MAADQCSAIAKSPSLTAITVKYLILLSNYSLFFLAYGINCFAQRSENPLANYVNMPDSSYSWQTKRVTRTLNGSFYEIDLTSQTWHKIIWRHQLILYVPEKAKYPNTLLLVLRHIYNRNADFASLKIISDSTNTAAATLYGIPNQPLFDGREEDDLQAYTFSEYIKSGDESWPLLFPMVKSVMRAMDAIQDLTKRESKAVITNFVISGHSKRGHTTWLTAAVDPRVKGIIPIAIDILNSARQLPHHREAFGGYSTPSKAASALLEKLELPRGKDLIQMVDAYSYKDQLTLPKLIVSATNDQFFTTDALNLYWSGLRGPKWILYLSNANHVSAYSDPRVNSTAFAFVRAIASNKILPQFTWEFKKTDVGVLLKITTDSSATNARIWLSNSLSKDFRQSIWLSKSMHRNEPGISTSNKNDKTSRTFYIEVPNPLRGFNMFFGEIECVQDSRRFLLSTQTYLSSSK